MTKKITISVPDDLHEKMLKYKSSFNFSKVFQGAISDLIQKKENFINRVKGDTDIKAVVKRLKKEKTMLEKNLFVDGKEEGFEWAKTAHYVDLQDALSWEVVHGADPRGHENHNIKGYFDHVIGEHLDLGFDDYGHSSDHLDRFVDGWKEGVEAFWNEVKDKI